MLRLPPQRARARAGDPGLALIPATPDSRAAQQDKFETFLRKLTFLSCGNQTDPLPKSKPIKIKVQQNQSPAKSKSSKIKVHKKSKSIKIEECLILGLCFALMTSW